MHSSSGALSIQKVNRGIKNPSYLALAPKGRFLFCVNELKEYNNGTGGSVSSFAIESSGELRFINTVASRGSDPCYISVNKAETHVLVSNYSSGSICVFPFDRDGTLHEASCVIQHQGKGYNPSRQERPHAIFLDTENKTAFAADLGLDKIFAYTVDFTKGLLIPEKTADIAVAPGSGPRHCVFNQTGDILYIINELSLSLAACGYNRKQKIFSPPQSLALIKNAAGTDKNGPEKINTGADIGLHPNGKWLYASVRGPDIIVVCETDPSSGRLKILSTHSSGGKTPRNFSIDPTGRWLLAGNQDSDEIVVFSINSRDGSLSEASRLAIPNPVCIKPVLL